VIPITRLKSFLDSIGQILGQSGNTGRGSFVRHMQLCYEDVFPIEEEASPIYEDSPRALELERLENDRWASEDYWSPPPRAVLQRAESIVGEILSAAESLKSLQDNGVDPFPHTKVICIGNHYARDWETLETLASAAGAYDRSPRLAGLASLFEAARELPRMLVRGKNIDWHQCSHSGPLGLIAPPLGSSFQAFNFPGTFTAHIDALVFFAIASFPEMLVGRTNRLIIRSNRGRQETEEGGSAPLSPSALSMLVHTAVQMTRQADSRSGEVASGDQDERTLTIYGPLRRSISRVDAGPAERYDIRNEPEVRIKALTEARIRDEAERDELQADIDRRLPRQWKERLRVDFLDDAPECACEGTGDLGGRA
jgi:hypothetical protein